MAEQEKMTPTFRWRTVIVIPHKNMYEKVRELCVTLDKKNDKFTFYTPNKTRGKGPKYQVWIYSVTKEEAYERGDLFHQKFGVRYYVNPR
ncbi:MAG: hypothetical protein ACTSRG_12110 [Candidatus Helarchaeota archaeon]